MSVIEAKIAKIALIILYGLMVLIPVLGYVQSRAYEFSDGIHLFGFLVQSAILKDDQIFEIANRLRRVLGFILFAIVTMYVTGVIKHRFFDEPENDCLR